VLALSSVGSAPAPAEVSVAFIGDQGLGADPVAVLQLILDEGADAVVHSGDFDYGDDAAAWDAQIDGVLGPDFSPTSRPSEITTSPTSTRRAAIRTGSRRA
jgi:hypothetical protein